LTMNGMLLKSPTKYEFSDPLFKHWIEINVLKKYN